MTETTPRLVAIDWKGSANQDRRLGYLCEIVGETSATYKVKPLRVGDFPATPGTWISGISLLGDGTYRLNKKNTMQITDEAHYDALWWQYQAMRAATDTLAAQVRQTANAFWAIVDGAGA